MIVGVTIMDSGIIELGIIGICNLSEVFYPCPWIVIR